MNELKVTVTSNIDELKPLIDKAVIKAKELQDALDEINKFKVKVGFENSTST